MTYPIFGACVDDDETARVRHAALTKDVVDAAWKLGAACDVLAKAAAAYHKARKYAGVIEGPDAPAPAKGYGWDDLLDIAEAFKDVPALEAKDFVREGDA